ncbi:ATP-dependent DNA helicase [Roseburia sp. MUC/MUC-530-WT-4D]|uniref:ATP-dependent DNA helicase n=1 Tax=Roseburia porci TaxID=2605790 RepID=A0A6L5YUD2_9FIRM|nr:ATP-dependent DNA helicase [Roseburia porci]MST75988.1 ATP-dependent DNA helicase [Roseburia porci]
MEQEKPQVRISVRNLVEFIFREGDIDNRRKSVSADAMMEGTRIHRKIQKSKDERYLAEVPLKISLDEKLYQLTIEGRADGIFTEEDDFAVIDEIKGVYMKLEQLEKPIYVHQAQAMCYAYIFAWQNQLPEIGIQMTYCNLDTEEIRYFRENYRFEELEQWFLKLITEYKKWADFQYQWKEKRQASIHQLEFPYEYRPGQHQLVADVYRTINRKKNLFIQAPTGVGKTISTIFPAVKAVGEGLGDRIFYLTAKTITATVAKETFGILREAGYQAKLIQLTAKEKLCLCEEMECNPVHCPYAKGHFDRVNDAVFDLLHKSDFFTREEIIAQAKEYQVCPFEMSLDVASWADDIICDYNYVFDPNVYLKRFFQEGIKGDYIFLIDEAHNLVDRSREMYSASLYKEDFLTVKKILKPLSRKLEKNLDKCNKILLDYKRECEKFEIYDNIANLLFGLMRLASDMDEFLQKNPEFAERKTVLEFYMNLRNFLNIYELVDEHYVIYTEIQEDGRFMMKLYCVDPSLNLQKCLDKGNSAIFFSATFLPINYYKQLLSTKEDNYAVYATSTFKESQRLLLFGKDVSTKYTRRTPSEFEKIADYIGKTIACHPGNYMVFFPSYKLMEQVHEVFMDKYGDEAETILQQSGMKEEEREEFLLNFEENHAQAFVAFCVMGGIFGEGIDLKKDRLIGVIVVGTGLPQISNEREILRQYYDKNQGEGFDYAFRYPGMNKVLQAAGRVIRTNEDRGIILLLDERFLQSEYRNLYPREWKERKICSLDDVQNYVSEFWNTIPEQKDR